MSSQEIIDLSGALEICGGDEDFLQELIRDLKMELGTQTTKIQNALCKEVRQH